MIFTNKHMVSQVSTKYLPSVRAKKLASSQWVEGWFTMYPFGRFPASPAIIESWAVMEEGRHENIQINMQTLCFNTGWTYFKGGITPIWTGDIVKIGEYSSNFVVEYSRELGSFIIRDLNNFKITYKFCEINEGDVQHIGNIFDDPGLKLGYVQKQLGGVC